MCEPAFTLTTDELSRASFLSLQGLPYKLAFKDGVRAKAVFIFGTRNDEETTRLKALDGEFSAGMSRVEPLSYLREVAAVRGRLYDFLRLGSES